MIFLLLFPIADRGGADGRKRTSLEAHPETQEDFTVSQATSPKKQATLDEPPFESNLGERAAESLLEAHTDETFDPSATDLVDDSACLSDDNWQYLPLRTGKNMISLLKSILEYDFELAVVDENLGGWWFYGVSAVVRLASTEPYDFANLVKEALSHPRVSRTSLGVLENDFSSPLYFPILTIFYSALTPQRCSSDLQKWCG